MTDQEIKSYVQQLSAKGASIEDIDKFVSSAIKERESKPIESDSFLSRLKAGFGTKEERAKIKEPKGFLKGGLSEIPKDIADFAGKTLPLAGMIGGGIIGGGAGLFGGGPAGAIAGGALGAGVGAGIGEKARQDIGTGLGLQKAPISDRVKEVLGEGAIGALSEVGGRALPIIAKPIVSKVVSPITGVVKDFMKNAISVMTSVPEKAIERALISPVVKQGFNKNVTAETIRTEIVNAYNAVKKKVGENFRTGLDKLMKENKTGVSGYPNIQLNKQVSDATKGLPALFRKFSIGVKKDGLDFSKSSIVKSGEQSNLQAAYDTIKNQKDFSVKGVQETAARLSALTKFSDGAINVKSAVIAGIHDVYDKAIQKSFPKLRELRTEYGVMSQMLKNADDVINATKNKNVKAVHSAVAKLTNLFKEDNDIYINSLLALEKASGKEFLNKLAGTEFQRIMPGILRTSLAVGGISQLTKSAVAIFMVPLFSPRFWGGTLVKIPQSKVILESIFKNYLGVNALDASTKTLINQILQDKLK